MAGQRNGGEVMMKTTWFLEGERCGDMGWSEEGRLEGGQTCAHSETVGVSSTGDAVFLGMDGMVSENVGDGKDERKMEDHLAVRSRLSAESKGMGGT